MRKATAALILTLLSVSVLPMTFNVQIVKAGPETLIIGTTDSVESSLDPAEAYDYFGWNIIQNIGCGLVDFRPGSTASIEDIIPALATDWSVSSDGLIWSFILRQGVRYDDGTEFNATHVKYSFDRGIGIADGAFVGIGYTGIIENVTVADKYTVKFYLKIPFAAFLSLMACQASYIVDPAHAPMTAVVEYNSSRTVRENHPMGLGPYKLANWTRTAGKDSAITLEANPNYWNASGGYPKTAKITVRFYPDSTSLRSAIELQEIDLAFRQLSMDDIDALKHNETLRVWEGTGDFIQYLVFQTKSEMYPLNITEVRRAIAAAINRTVLTETVFLGQMEPLYSTIPNGIIGHVDAFKVLGDANYTYTRALLAGLGYNESNKLSFDLWYESSGHYPMSAEQALLYKEALEASDVISVTLKSADWASYRQNRNNEMMDVYVYGWYPDYIDPDDYTYPLLHSTGGAWLHDNYANPEMDTLIENARITTNATERNQIYAQIQFLMAENCPIVPLFQGKTCAVTRLSVEGIYLDMSQLLRYWPLHMTEMGPTTWIVDDDGPADFHTIQEAINAASPRDAIFVRAGTYYENVIVNKTVAVVGESRYTTIIDGNGTGTVVRITANNVNVSGFTVENGYSGLTSDDSSSIVVSDNVVSNNQYYGIAFNRCNNSLIQGNVARNSSAGIAIWYSNNTWLIDNNASENWYGIRIKSTNNVLRNSTMTDNHWNLAIEGESLSELIHDIDSSNTVDGRPVYYWVGQNSRQVPSDAGFVAAINCSDITIRNANLMKNNIGVLLWNTSDSIIEHVNVSDNWVGIALGFSCNNTLCSNTISNSAEEGIVVAVSNDNRIAQNNFIDYGQKPYAYESFNNKWDDGYPSGGNYWSDIGGADLFSGTYQNETGSDGIRDMPCSIDENNTDAYPLMTPVSFFDAGTWNGKNYYVPIISNSTLSDFYFNPNEGAFARFWVTGETETETFGFCRVAVPKDLLWTEDGWNVLCGSYPLSYKVTTDENYTYLYFAYQNPYIGVKSTINIYGTHSIPEFPSFLVILLFLPLFAIAIAFAKRAIFPTNCRAVSRSSPIQGVTSNSTILSAVPAQPDPTFRQQILQDRPDCCNSHNIEKK